MRIVTSIFMLPGIWTMALSQAPLVFAQQPVPPLLPERIATPLPVPNVADKSRAMPAKEVNLDEQKLLAAGLSADGPALVEFFRQRSRRDVDMDTMLATARRLGDSDSRVRAQALRVLVGHGATALPGLRRLINDLGDAELSSRAAQCMKLIEGDGAHDLPTAAARLLVLRKPPGALEALLAYLPGVETPGLGEEVASALSALAYPKGHAHPALLAALQDPAPLTRAVAGAALVRKAQPETWATVRKLLRDPTALVRFRVGLALAEADDAAAVPVLIELITEVALPQSRHIEEALGQLAGDWAPNPAVGGDDDIARRIRRDAWAGWWRNTDGPMLLAEFRRRMLSPAERDKVTALIDQLADPSSDVRHRAVADLIAFGPRAAPLLRESSAQDDKRLPLAQDVLREIGDKTGKPLPTAAARLLALRQPPGAGEVLLDFLPFADEAMSAAVQSALCSLPVRSGPLADVLLEALDHKQPGRRMAAAEVLIKAGSTQQRQAVRRLLRDADTQVRLRTALHLAAAGDRDAVPVLIDFVALDPAAGGPEAEDFLFRLAGDTVPKLEPAADTAGRRKQRDAWLAWWKTKGSAIDLAALDQHPLLGYTLIVEGNNGNRVYELGRDGKPRWIIANLAFPVDAHVLPGNRVLIAEWSGNRVTERDFKGNILWQRALTGRPVNVQRFSNGNTFIALQAELLEVDRDGKAVWTQPVPQGVLAAYRSRDGVITRLTNNGHCVRLNLAGKELKTFTFSANGCSSGIDGLPSGRILVAEGNAKVTELDAEGKTVWQADAPGIASATRLPNGHTLVASNGTNSVTELDRRGRIVWEYKEAASVFRARRR